MVFSAMFACADCKLRFTRRSQCPSCGSTRIFSLGTREGRGRFRAATRKRLGLWVGLLLRLGPWAPRRAYLPIGLGILLMIPALAGPLTRPLAVVGAVIIAFTLLARHGNVIGEQQRPAPTRMRVFSPNEEAHGDTTLTGIARRASVEIGGPISNEPCLLFGLEGEIGEADLADADGGDFDLELPSGERVMVSLEHA